MSNFGDYGSEEISLEDLLYVLIKRWKLIIAVTLMSVVISGLVSVYVIEPQYETFTTLMLGKQTDFNGESAGYNYQDVLFNQRLVKTYSEIAKSKTVLYEVINNLDLDTNYGQLKNRITVSLLNETEIIKISVSGSQPEKIQAIANEMAIVFMDDVSEIMQFDNVHVIDYAEIPHAPFEPRIFLNICIAGVLGLMVSVGYVFLIEFLDQTIKTPDEIRDQYGIPVLGIIPIEDN